MTPQSTAAVAGQVRTVPPEAPHRHDSACFWDVDECRWQCVTYRYDGVGRGRVSAHGRVSGPMSATGRPIAVQPSSA
jgi:hypothetical protein